MAVRREGDSRASGSGGLVGGVGTSGMRGDLWSLGRVAAALDWLRTCRGERRLGTGQRRN